MSPKLHPTLSAFIPFVKGLAETFGSNCEVIMHDFTDLQHSVIAIENGHVTGRSIGSPMMEASLKLYVNDKIDEDNINYTGKSADGRVLKSSTMFIKDEKGKVLGCLCINFDITELVAVQKVMNDLMKVSGSDIGDKLVETNNQVVNIVSSVLKDIVNETIQSNGKPIIYLSKEEKVGIVDILDRKGAFLIKGAIDYVAEVLCVSRYTIYNYLDEIREPK
jgi:predicted transcriptional regulator YheO